MKHLFLVCCVAFLVYYKAADAMPKMDFFGDTRCVNMWDEGCINGQLPGSDNNAYLTDGYSSGRRCMDVWDEGCVDGYLKGADDDYLGGGFNPGKRSLYELLAKLQRKHQIY